jgi:hypothetical protein
MHNPICSSKALLLFSLNLTNPHMPLQAATILSHSLTLLQNSSKNNQYTSPTSPKTNNLLPPQHFGFRSHMSCDMAALTLIKMIFMMDALANTSPLLHFSLSLVLTIMLTITSSSLKWSHSTCPLSHSLDKFLFIWPLLFSLLGKLHLSTHLYPYWFSSRKSSFPHIISLIQPSCYSNYFAIQLSSHSICWWHCYLYFHTLIASK